jgi:hypothetical protein
MSLRRALALLKDHPIMMLARSILCAACIGLVAACSPTQGAVNGGPTTHGGGVRDMTAGNGGNGNTDGGAVDTGDMSSVAACHVTCAQLNASCGIQADGCGGQQDCGSCTNAGESCGGAGTPNVCGAASSGGPGGACVPTTCAALGYNCGPAGDGCGNPLDCWPAGTTSCPTAGDICGGGGKPGVCGNNGSGGTTCTGPLCPATCPMGQTTTIEGYVYAPTPSTYGSPDPLPNAVVYIPTAPVDPIPSGASCTQCTPASGSPIAYATSDDKGHFVLTNTPAGAAGTIPLVVQLGKWRRQTNISVAITACTDNKLTNSDDSRLPRTQTDSTPAAAANIPKMALVTGAYDEIECTLLKMGVATSEFTNPTGTGRVSIYQNNGNYIDSSTPVNDPAAGSTPLTGTEAALKANDMVILDCIGSTENVKGQDATLANYINNDGGRVFASHFEYSWLASQWTNVATWSGGGDDFGDGVTATIDSANTMGTPGFDLATWLYDVDGGAYSFGTISVDQVKESVSAVVASAVHYFMTYNASGTTRPLELTWDAPVGSPASAQCGRVVFADFHVDLPSGNSTNKQLFPSSGKGPCTKTPNPMSVQEKVLEYMLFNLSSCITPPPPPPPPTCMKVSCATLGIGCGPAPDGCGGSQDCGMCTTPGDTCGGGGTPFQCGQTHTCTPTTCAALGYDCGPAGNGCGGVLDCGTCASPETCGGSGSPGVCGGIL